MRIFCFSTVALLLPLGGIVFAAAGDVPPLQVVDNVDLTRYVGTWYAIASIPTWFERPCVQGTTATYTLLENGKIEVVNRCYNKKGEMRTARGRAWVVDETTNAKLKVSFFSLFGLWLFPGDYWIIDLDSEYRYVAVGHPSRKYGWILSRTPALDPSILNGIIERLEGQGYDFDAFETTDQSIHVSDVPRRPEPPLEGETQSPSETGG
jgi:apolipoprotein D and lipocalin family protein